MSTCHRSAIDRYVPQRTHASLFDGTLFLTGSYLIGAGRAGAGRTALRHTACVIHAGAFRPEWLDPEMRAAMACGTDAAILGVVERLAEGIYSFPLFTREVSLKK